MTVTQQGLNCTQEDEWVKVSQFESAKWSICFHFIVELGSDDAFSNDSGSGAKITLRLCSKRNPQFGGQDGTCSTSKSSYDIGNQVLNTT